MLKNPVAQFTDAERAELELVIQALSRWPRLSNLLRYMGDKLFVGEIDQISECNIATEVLGRSKAVFNPSEDAIARVEVHRLRKQIATYYENEGRSHPVQVLLPPGSYIPAFVHRTTRSAGPTAVSPGVSELLSVSGEGKEVAPSFPWKFPRWQFLGLALCVLVACIGLFAYLRSRPARVAVNTHLQGAPSPTVTPSSVGSASIPLRILAGYSGPARTDSAGRVWGADRYFISGGTWQTGVGFVSRTSDQFLFQHSRTGDFNYAIPLKPGLYELHLYFLTQIRFSEALSTFGVRINGTTLFDNFDVNIDAGGPNIADERVFRDISPGKDGYLRIGFFGQTGQSWLNALEILPGLPHKQLPIRLVTQTTPFTDHIGQMWQPDNYFESGRLASQTHSLLNSPDPDLFSLERYGHFMYAIPADTRDKYTLILHFAELYFGSAGRRGAGSRTFKVMCNGETLLDGFDIFQEAGALHEIGKAFHHLRPTVQGKFNITFEPIVNNASVSGIELLDENE